MTTTTQKTTIQMHHRLYGDEDDRLSTPDMLRRWEGPGKKRLLHSALVLAACTGWAQGAPPLIDSHQSLSFSTTSLQPHRRPVFDELSTVFVLCSSR
jgi:hypothetical protein